MAQRKETRRRPRPAGKTPGRDKPDLSRFVAPAQEAIGLVARGRDELRRYLRPIDELSRRHPPTYEPDARLVEYARDFTTAHLEVSRGVGQAVMDGSLGSAITFLSPWGDLDIDLLRAPQLSVYLPDAPGSTADPSLRYKLEWTHTNPELNVFDPVARVSRWRDQLAIASKVEGKCIMRAGTNGDESDSQAGVGVLFQPGRSRGFFQFRALALWTSWVSISADDPPVPPPWPTATSQSYGAVRLVAQSWRASDATDFRTDAIRDIEVWNHFVTTPNRVWALNESGIANPGVLGWIELPANRDRVYALWVILRGWSRSTYALPSLSSAIVSGSCLVPFIIVEH
jgi:hypothetical protein